MEENNTNNNVVDNVKAPNEEVQTSQTPIVETPQVASPPVVETTTQVPNTEATTTSNEVEPKKEEAKEEVKPVEPKKEEKPKKKSYKGTIFFIFLLFLIIVGLIAVIMKQDELKKVKKGVTDLNTIVVPEKEPEKIADSKKVIDSLDPSVQESIVNFLLQEEETSYITYLTNLDNDNKLYLADILKNNSITLDSIKTNLESKFGTNLNVEGKDLLDLKDKTKKLYEFNPKTVMFEKQIELGSVDYKPFKIDGELMILEYDDPVGTKDEYSITVYSAFLIRNKDVESIRNKKDTLAFDKELSIDEIKNNIMTYYSDHKEEFDRITYKFKKNNKFNKMNLIDVSIN